MTKKEIRKTFDDEDPCLVKSHDIHVDADYAEWIAEVKHRYRSAQVKAALKVNAEKLLFNWQLGRDLVQKKAEERWGAGVVEQVSLDLRREFPEEDGFSARNLRYMKQWYLYYTTDTGKLQRPVVEIMIQAGVELNIAKLQRPVAEMNETWMSSDIETFPFPFAFVPWGQHIEIMTRSQSLQEALFYIQQVIEKGLSRPALINCFKAHLYEHQGKIGIRGRFFDPPGNKNENKNKKRLSRRNGRKRRNITARLYKNQNKNKKGHTDTTDTTEN